MQLRKDFNFELPVELIAQKPADKRTGSRLLVLDNQELADKNFVDILDFIQPNDLLVFNNTKVIAARLFGQKTTGGKVELLIERVLPHNQAWCHIKASKAPKAGSKLLIENQLELTVLGREDALFLVEFAADKTPLEWLEEFGHMPLPPYITRADELADKTRYQTVYSEHPGAVAAPTAGLHFDQEILTAIKEKGADLGFVTLHVGAGTFKPVQAEKIADHKMHAEWFSLEPGLVAQVKAARQKGGRVIAVGSTSVRCLESASKTGELVATSGETDIFITPGYEFRQVDVLITNFHLPESTLIMLVSAFAGYKNTMRAYQHAVANQYRFFSYGDSMLIFKEQKDGI